MFIPLKITTEYSLLKSLIKLDDLINFLIRNNIKACGICDDELFGVMEFYLKCKNNNINPIIGLDVVIDNFHYYVYPKNYLGYQKLLKINTLKFNKKLTFEDIEDKNIIIVIPYNSIDSYQEFKNKDNVYLGYSKLSEKKNALLISSNVVFAGIIRSLKKENIFYLEYLQKLGGTFVFKEEEYYNQSLLDADDIKRLEDFSSLINIEMPFDKKYIPVYKENIDSYAYLKSLTFKGLEKRLNGIVTEVYQKRAEYELSIIKSMNFVDYFLVVYDYVLYAKKNGILVGPGRGSAAGSLVSYAIGITNIDPIKYNLLFERFLNPSRIKMPDIDIDFEDTKRSDIISYVKNKYGKEKVALGITFNSLKSKLILRELAKVLNIDSLLFEKFIKNIFSNKSLGENSKNPVIGKYLNLYPELKKLYDVALHLENLKKNVSTHAAGVVICSASLDEIIPIYEDESGIRTGIAMEYLEKLGLLKMDFLGLRNLSLIGSVASKIPNFSIDNISLDDEKVYQLFKSAQTDDIFQFESSYAKNALSKLQVNNFNELSIAIALVRPGPSNQIDEYIKNKNSNSINVHPDLESILNETRGVIIFQEQVMKILEKIGSYTPFEADNIRVAMSKKNESIINKEYENFISSALKNGYDKKFSDDIFNQIRRFAEYGFNKSHSVAYALLAYQMAYLKVNYPLEFAMSILENLKDIETKKRIFNELKKNNIKILKPNINVSNNNYQAKNNYLLLPFNSIKNIGNVLIENIINARTKTFDDIFDFVSKCQEFLNEENFASLVKAGVLDTFKYTKKSLIEQSDIIFNYAFLNDSNAIKPELENMDEYDDATLRDFEINSYGFYIGNHPCSVYHSCVKLNKTKDYLFKNIDLILLVEKISKIKTKKGEDMAFIKVSDETGEGELIVFNNAFKDLIDIKEKDIVNVNAKSSRRFDKYQIIVNNIKRK